MLKEQFRAERLEADERHRPWASVAGHAAIYAAQFLRQKGEYMEKNDVIDTLNDLIQTCKDGEEGFRTCAEDIKDIELKSYFNNRAERCTRAAEELQDLVVAYGGDPKTSSHISGALHRRWVDIRSAITGKSEQDVLEECERGEDVAKHHYEAALAKPLPQDVRQIVEDQYRGVQLNHDQVKSFRNQARTRQ
jgi:uncharacterized protein (TIGR02284 family)